MSEKFGMKNNKVKYRLVLTGGECMTISDMLKLGYTTTYARCRTHYTGVAKEGGQPQTGAYKGVLRRTGAYRGVQGRISANRGKQHHVE